MLRDEHKENINLEKHIRTQTQIKTYMNKAN